MRIRRRYSELWQASQHSVDKYVVQASTGSFHIASHHDCTSAGAVALRTSNLSRHDVISEAREYSKRQQDPLDCSEESSAVSHQAGETPPPTRLREQQHGRLDCNKESSASSVEPTTVTSKGKAGQARSQAPKYGNCLRINLKDVERRSLEFRNTVKGLRSRDQSRRQSSKANFPQIQQSLRINGSEARLCGKVLQKSPDADRLAHQRFQNRAEQRSLEEPPDATRPAPQWQRSQIEQQGSRSP